VIRIKTVTETESDPRKDMGR